MVNQFGNISPRTAGFAVARLLERGQYLLTTERFGSFDAQPQNKTKTRKWRRYESLDPATAPLAEGVSPAGKRMTFTDVTAVLQQYGDLVILTDVIQDTHEDPVLAEYMDIVGEQAAETIEIVRITTLKAGSNVFYGGGVASRAAVNSVAARGDFRLMYRAFKRNKATEISRIISPTANIATEPVMPAYFAMGHTDLDADLRGIPGFIPWQKYSQPGQALPGEIGASEQIRIILTGLFSPWLAAGTAGTTYLSGGVAVASSTAADVYPIITVGRNAYGIVPLQGKNAVTPIVLNPNNPNGADRLGQQGSVGWKTWQTVGRLNELWMARLEVAATANPS